MLSHNYRAAEFDEVILMSAGENGSQIFVFVFVGFWFQLLFIPGNKYCFYNDSKAEMKPWFVYIFF